MLDTFALPDTELSQARGARRIASRMAEAGDFDEVGRAIDPARQEVRYSYRDLARDRDDPTVVVTRDRVGRIA